MMKKVDGRYNSNLVLLEATKAARGGAVSRQNITGEEDLRIQ